MAFENESSKTGQPRLLLTAAVAAGKKKIDAGYDVPVLNRYEIKVRVSSRVVSPSATPSKCIPPPL